MSRFSQRDTDLPVVQRRVMKVGIAEKLGLLETVQYMEMGNGAGYTVRLRTLWILQSKNWVMKWEKTEMCTSVRDWGGICREQDVHLWKGK